MNMRHNFDVAAMLTQPSLPPDIRAVMAEMFVCTKAAEVTSSAHELTAILATQRSEDLQELSTHDPLTGLLNRRGFDESIDSLYRTALRENLNNDEKITLNFLVFDLDHFKQVNDTFGHVTGDKVLQAFAREIQSVIHRPNDLHARFGGEEFVMAFVAPENIATHIARKIAEIIRSATEKNCRISITGEITTVNADGAKPVTCSIGIASLTPTNKDMDRKAIINETIEKADAALYAAKNSWRNCVYYTSSNGNILPSSHIEPVSIPRATVRAPILKA